MKISKNVFSNITKLTLLLLFVLITQSCETEIPPEDPTPPEFSFRITGDGFDHTFTQDSDFDNIILKLRRNTSYNFTFIGSDAGGVQRIQWDIIEAGYITLDTPISAPWTSRYVSPNQQIQWRGDRSNPLTGSALTGSFTVPDFRTFLVFRLGVSDFGGETRRPNHVYKELNLSIGNSHHTRIGDL